MGLLDRAKEAAEQAATKARQGVDDVQSKREATQAYGELGHEAFRLIEAGEVSHPALEEIAARIRAAESSVPGSAATPSAAQPSAAEPADPPPAPPPPAMPS